MPTKQSGKISYLKSAGIQLHVHLGWKMSQMSTTSQTYSTVHRAQYWVLRFQAWKCCCTANTLSTAAAVTDDSET